GLSATPPATGTVVLRRVVASGTAGAGAGVYGGQVTNANTTVEDSSFSAVTTGSGGAARALSLENCPTGNVLGTIAQASATGSGQVYAVYLLQQGSGVTTYRFDHGRAVAATAGSALT